MNNFDFVSLIEGLSSKDREDVFKLILELSQKEPRHALPPQPGLPAKDPA
jgi:hypothetical protein